ncbi:MAG: hypothetical protein ACRCUS_02250, partial [Anaerovoracaceae bacterium]
LLRIRERKEKGALEDNFTESTVKPLIKTVIGPNSELELLLKEAKDLNKNNWDAIESIKSELGRDGVNKKSITTQIAEAIASKNYEEASRLQLYMQKRLSEVTELYLSYKKNFI